MVARSYGMPVLKAQGLAALTLHWLVALTWTCPSHRHQRGFGPLILVVPLYTSQPEATPVLCKSQDL